MSRVENGAVNARSLTQYIKKDLENRIRSGELGSKDLSLMTLAAQYKVSITPLRLAIDALVKEGVVRKLPNRRLEIGPEAASGGVAPHDNPAPPTSTDWGEAFLHEVVHASLSAAPAYLREDGLAQKYGVGRSVVRQVLSQFVGAGLIDHIPRRGWRVHPLGVEDMNAYLAVRETLELKALRLARKKLDIGELRRVRELCSSGALGNLQDFDNSVHDCIINASGNRYIRLFFQQHVARYYTELFYFAAPETAVVEEMSNQHLEIIDALIARDWAKAERFLSAHIRGQAAVLLKLLEKERGGTAAKAGREAS